MSLLNQEAYLFVIVNMDTKIAHAMAKGGKREI